MKKSIINNIEYKVKYTDDLKRDVVAFLNTNGGTIYIGFNNDKSICGIDDLTLTTQQITTLVNQLISPSAEMFITVFHKKIENKNAIKIIVEKGADAPYYLSEKGLNPTGAFIRKDSNNIPISDSLIRKMIENSNHDSFENNRSIYQELTFSTFFSKMKKNYTEYNDFIMTSLGLLSENDFYTNLGLLLSDQCSHVIQLTVFDDENSLNIKERKEFTGSVVKQLIEVYKTLLLYNDVKDGSIDSRKLNSLNYPLQAIKEALVNAIIHRDYSLKGNININIFNNKIEIISLGGLPDGITLDAIMLGVSQPRNIKLANVFYCLKYIETFGNGVNKIISSYNNYSKKPVIECVKGAVKVTIYNRNRSNRVNIDDIRQDIINLFAVNKTVVRKDLEEKFNLSSDAALSILRKLQRENLIERTGVGLHTRYSKKRVLGLVS